MPAISYGVDSILVRKDFVRAPEVFDNKRAAVVVNNYLYIDGGNFYQLLDGDFFEAPSKSFHRLASMTLTRIRQQHPIN
jgi:hypothetical protein